MNKWMKDDFERLADQAWRMWYADTNDASARRDLKRLFALCGEVLGTDDWIGWMRRCAKAWPLDVHLGHLLFGGAREVALIDDRIVKRSASRLPFPPREVPDAARACLDVIRITLAEAARFESLHSTPTLIGDWRKLREFVAHRRSAIRKAAQRGHVETKTARGHREKLYRVEHVVRLYGPNSVQSAGHVERPSETRRDN